MVVVDNASTDGTSELIESQYPDVRIVQSAENLGTYAYSLGVEVARGTYLLMMDDDGLPVSTDWISEVVARFEANPRLGALACTVRMVDTGAIAHDSPQFVPEGSLEHGYPCVAYNGTGAGLRASAVRQVMPIYPRIYFRSWIELYLCTNLLKNGWEVRHFPDLEVWHCRHSGSSMPVLSYYGVRNYNWYVAQFYPSPDWGLEILHHFGSGVKSMLKGRLQPAVFLRAFRDAFLGMRRVLASRDPISAELYSYLKWVRRHGNDYGVTVKDDL